MELADRHFIVTGLPRSMSAWFANFLTCGPVHCWHEALKYCQHLDEVPNIMNCGAPIVGNADSAWPLFHGKVRLRRPKYVVIWRDAGDVKRSLEAKFGAETVAHVDMLHYYLTKFTSSVPCLQLSFDEAKTEHGAMTVWDYLFGNELPFPMARYAMLSTMNVQVIPEKELVDSVRPQQMLSQRLTELQAAL